MKTKITIDKSITKDLDFYAGKKTHIVIFVNEEYEVTIVTPIGWELKDISKIIIDSLFSLPITELISIHIKSIVEDISALN